MRFLLLSIVGVTCVVFGAGGADYSSSQRADRAAVHQPFVGQPAPLVGLSFLAESETEDDERNWCLVSQSEILCNQLEFHSTHSFVNFNLAEFGIRRLPRAPPV